MRTIRAAWGGAFLLAALAATPAIAQVKAPKVVFHGYMENREYGSQGSDPTYKAERVSLSAIVNLANQSRGYLEVYYHDWAPAKKLYLESAYYDMPLAGGRLRIGKGRSMTFGITPDYPLRRTSNYGLISEAFTQDRIHGIQYMMTHRALDLGLSLHTSYRIGKRAAGDLPGDRAHAATHTVAHLALRDIQDQISHNLEVTGRIGGHTTNGLNAGLSASYGTIDSRDLASLRGDDNALRPKSPITGAVGPAIGPGFTGRDIRLIGLDGSYKHPSGFVLQGERYWAHISDLSYGGWDLLAGIEPRVGWRFYARYGEQNMGLVPTDNPLTWSTNQLSLSVVQPLRKGIWLQYEYEINGERANVPGRVKNDVFFTELLTAF